MGKLQSHPRRHLTLGLSMAILTAAIVWLLWPVLCGPSVLVAADFLKMWPPWASRLSDGSLPHNTDLSDSILYYLPVRQHAASALAQGDIPLWNPYILSGTPFVADGESGVFSPLNALFYVLRTPVAFGYTAALQLFLAGMFMYLLLRRLEVGWAGSLFGALVFMLNGFFIVWLEMLNLVGVALWIPAVVLAADHWLEKRRPVVAVALMGLMGLQFLVGFLQVSLYLLFALFAYPVLERRRGSRMSTRRAARVVAEFTAMTLGGAALAAVQLLPHFELIARSHREAVPAVWRFVNWEYLRHLISLISPDHFGSPVGNTYHGALNYTEMCGYVGLLPALAALAGACRWGRRGAAYFSAVAFGALLVYLETPLNSLLWYVVPGYRLGIGSTRIVCLLTFAIAGLAGIGFDGLVKGSGAWRRWRYALCSVVFLLSFVELERFGRHHLTSVRESTVYPAVEAVDFMRRTPGPWRMMSTPGVFPPNSAMAYGLEAVEGYESLFPRRYREYMTKIDASVSRDPNFHGIVLSRYDSPLLDLLNVRFLVTDQQLSAPDLRLVYEDGVRIYERASALPRAFVVWRYRRLPDPRAVLDALGGADFRPAEEVLLEDEPQLPGVVGKGDADVRFEAYEAGRVTLRARLSAPGLLILADSHYPGWEVRVDGRPRSILVADYILRSVALDAGAHRVEFVFRPWSFWLGSVISTAAFFGILAAVIAYRAAGRA